MGDSPDPKKSAPTSTPIQLSGWQAADIVGRRIFWPFKRDQLLRERYGDNLLASEYQARIIEELHFNFPTISPSDFRRMPAFELVRYIEKLPASVRTRTAEPAEAVMRRKKRAPTETTTEAMITNALCEHHKYNDGQCGNREPAKLKDLCEILEWKVSKSTLSRFLKAKFCKADDRTNGYKRYAAACRSDRIGLFLKGFRGELPLAEQLYGKAPADELETREE